MNEKQFKTLTSLEMRLRNLPFIIDYNKSERETIYCCAKYSGSVGKDHHKPIAYKGRKIIYQNPGNGNVYIFRILFYVQKHQESK